MNTPNNDIQQNTMVAKNILIVEDNALNMRLFDSLLKSKGYETFQSIDGGDVMEVVKKHNPDLIIMDVQLPVRSGLEITKDLKSDEVYKMIPIIVVSAFSMKGDKNKVLESGCDDFMAKPISIPSFLEMVEKHL